MSPEDREYEAAMLAKRKAKKPKRAPKPRKSPLKWVDVGDGYDALKGSDADTTKREYTADGACLDLPWPPSNNTYYRHVGHKVLISAKGRDYHQRVAFAWLKYGSTGREGAPEVLRAALRPKPLNGRISLTIITHAPTERAFDLDNVPKAIQDALTRAGVWTDDSQIDELKIIRSDVENGGRVRVWISELPPITDIAAVEEK